MYKPANQPTSVAKPEPAVSSGSVVPDQSRRLESIDVLRGFDMFFLMQEEPGFLLAFFAAIHLPFRGIWMHQLSHTEWVGFTFWDFIAPLFLFIVGLSLPFSISHRIARGESKRKLLGHIFRRTIILILLGLVFNGILQLDIANFRYAGVLQRIALSYFFAALITLYTNVRSQIIWTAVLLLGYWAIMTLIPVPSYGPGNLTPQGNLESFIDQRFLPGKFCCFIYGDNEGYLSTIPSIATVLFGVLCGHLVRSSQSSQKKLQILAGGGVLSLAVGLLWGLKFPIITRLWTSSYTVFSNGWAMLIFALFFWIIDIKQFRKWAFPFKVIGLNSITIYVVQGIFNFLCVATVFVGGLANHAGAYSELILATSVLAVKWLFLYFLYRQKIFIKI
jgi:predicted acyltransferase